MTEIQSFEELGAAVGAVKSEAVAAPVHVRKVDAQGRSYATGKPQERHLARLAAARHRQDHRQRSRLRHFRFARPVLQMLILQPILAAARDGQFDIVATCGGGLSGQAGALRHGISKALTYFEPELRGVLKPYGFLTRDSRVVERKKYGRRKAAQLPVLQALISAFRDGRIWKRAGRRVRPFFASMCPVVFTTVLMLTAASSIFFTVLSISSSLY